MQRTIWFLLILVILLSACAAPLPTEVAAHSTTATAAPAAAATLPVPVTGAPETAATPMASAIPVATATPQAAATEAPLFEAIVDSPGGLNLRYGPGLNYRVSAVLSDGQTVGLEGRSADGSWLVVRLADGTAGWVYAAYLKARSDLPDLPILEAAGGPEQIVPQPEKISLPGKYTLYMTIEDNLATVSLLRFPASSDLVVRLSVPSEGLSMAVASGRTDENGAAAIRFEMPRYWPDGSRVNQSALRLVVSTADGSLSRGANITYDSGE